ncbi:MAG: AarF/UbiB family protein [Anaerococcus sp.]|nr:AarF/UbiB family protein [Anaerococcus sp.]
MKIKRIAYQKRRIEILLAFLRSGILKAFREAMSVDQNLIEDRKSDKEKDRALGIKMKETFETLGPTFVKFGQMLSTRSDIFSKETIEELEKLQDDVDPISFETIREVFYEDFKEKIENSFAYIDQKPLASGSIAQVHKAKIIDHDKEIKLVVKVQRKGLREKVNLDIKILEDLIQKYLMDTPLGGSLDIKNMVRVFKKNLYFEMDFKIEAKNLEKFRKNNKKDKYIHTPRLIKSLCSTRVMTMEEIPGQSIKALDRAKTSDKTNLANRLVYSYVNQFFRDGYFHADPHPGNIFIMEEDHLGLIDFGIVGKLSANYRYQIMKIFMGISYNQPVIITDAVIEMGLLRPSRANIREFEMDLSEILDKYLDLSLHEMKLTDMIGEFFDLLKNHKIIIPSSLFNFGKTVIILEGVIERLVENQSLVELAYPIAEKISHRFFSLETLKERSIPKAFDLYTLAKEIPSFTLSTMRQVADGGISIKIKEDPDLIKEKNKIDQRKATTTLILALTILLASIILALAILGGGSFLRKFLEIFLIGISIIFFFTLLSFVVRRRK